MIYFTKSTTQKGYPFNYYRTTKSCGNIVVLSEYESIDHKKQLSLTNNIESVLEYLTWGLSWGRKDCTFYQWGDDGLFKLEVLWAKKMTGDLPPFKVEDVKWKYISNKLDAFEVLYAD